MCRTASMASLVRRLDDDIPRVSAGVGLLLQDVAWDRSCALRAGVYFALAHAPAEVYQDKLGRVPPYSILSRKPLEGDRTCQDEGQEAG